MKKIIYGLMLILCLFLIGSCKNKKIENVKIEDYKLVIVYKNGKVETKDELSEENYLEYYEIYKKYNETSIDAESWFKEVSRPYIINVLIENNELINYYSNGNRESLGKITNENFENLYEHYKKYNKDYNKTALEWFKEFSAATIVNVVIEDNQFFEIYSNDDRVNLGFITQDNYLELYSLYIKYNENYLKDQEEFFDEFAIHNDDDNNFEYNLVNGKYWIKKYNGSEKEITIPEYYKSKRVVGISKNAFKRSTIEKVIFSKNIIEIEESAFFFCSNLAEIVFNANLTKIGATAFSFCNALVNVTLPNGLISLENGVFSYSENLREVKLPDSLEIIGSDCFKNCTSLQNIVLPNKLKTISSGAFSNCESLVEITIPNLIQELPEQAFYHCISMEKVVLCDNIVKIGSYCFSSCKSLNNVCLPSSLETLDGGAFDGCTSLQEIIFPDTLNKVGTGIFNGCTSLRKAIINEGLEALAASSFCGCSSLEEVTLSSTLIFMSNSCFSGCRSLKHIELPYGLTSVYDAVFSGCVSLEELIIPESVTSIGNSALNSCRSLTRIDIPDSVVDISDGALNGCYNIQIMTIPFFVADDNGNCYLRNYFYNMPNNLHTVIISDKCSEIPENAFINCGTVKTIVIGKGIKTINKNAFSGASNLEKLLYHGTKEEFNLIEGASDLNVLFYAEDWYYDKNGNIEIVK